MRFDRQEIENAALWQWEGDDFCVLSYPPKRSKRRTKATDLILAFKVNDGDAVRIATGLILVALEKIEARLKSHHARYIVSIPPHEAGKINTPCEHICQAVEREFMWLKHLPKALRRTKAVPKAAFSLPGERPTYDDHRKSIEYVGAVRDREVSFILLDDVLTTGSVSSACRDILVETIACERVIGLFLGRTE
ncbi:MAG: hypothetical protein L0338_38270 [Acidobacteria bacterium]|nr:hypothetical protein [Acidobacteriota bacterium]